MRRPVSALALCALLVTLAACTGSDTSVNCLTDGRDTCREVDLSGRDFSGRDLSGFDFSGADLSGSDFSGADLTDAVLAHADLRNAVFDRAALKRVSLFSARATGSSWAGADLEEADLEGADLRDAGLAGASLRNARLHDVNLAAGVLTDVDLSGALLANVFLGGADLSRSTLRNAVVTGTSLAGAELESVTWDGALLRREDVPPAGLAELGALICADASCEGPVRRGPFPVVKVHADAFRVVAYATARLGMVNGEGPAVVSRNLALSFMAAYGVYPDAATDPVMAWEPAPYEGAEAVRDVAAVVAAYSAGIALRRSPKGTAFDGRMRGIIFARDLTLWEVTRETPQVRGLVAAAAADSTKRAMARAAVDKFAERSTTFVPTGAWEPTPPAFVPALEPGWGTLLRYREGSERCAAPAPRVDPLVGANEARTLADAASAEQKAAARFWDDERVRTATPPGHWILIAGQVFDEEISAGRSTVEDAFATMFDMSVAMADTVIQVWADKYRYQTARPVTILAATDPGWNSYLGNPPFPAYPSGHAALSRAAAEILTRDLGSRSFEDTRGNDIAGAWLALNIKPRSFESFLHAAEEAGMSRIWGGIHVMEDYRGAVHIGECMGRLARKSTAE